MLSKYIEIGLIVLVASWIAAFAIDKRAVKRSGVGSSNAVIDRYPRLFRVASYQLAMIVTYVILEASGGLHFLNSTVGLGGAVVGSIAAWLPFIIAYMSLERLLKKRARRTSGQNGE